jgi:hypothetical protein
LREFKSTAAAIGGLPKRHHKNTWNICGFRSLARRRERPAKVALTIRQPTAAFAISAVISRVVVRLLKQEQQYIISEHQMTDGAVGS